MASSIVNATNFSAQSLSYTKPKANSAGGKSVGLINSNTKKALRLQTPTMLTWGVNVYENEGKDNSYDFSLQFPRDDFKTEDAEKALTAFKEMEDKIKADALENSKDWFGKKITSAEVIDALWTPMLRYPKNQETGEQDLSRPPNLRIKMPCWEGQYNFELYSMNGNQLFPDEEGSGEPETIITKGSNISCLITCGGIWFANGKFGVTWKLNQAVVKPKETLKGKCHITLSSEDRKILASDTSRMDDTNESPNVEDSDEEEIVAESNHAEAEAEVEAEAEAEAEVESAAAEAEEEEEEEVTPPPAPKKKKRVVKKASTES